MHPLAPSPPAVDDPVGAAARAARRHGRERPPLHARRSRGDAAVLPRAVARVAAEAVLHRRRTGRCAGGSAVRLGGRTAQRHARRRTPGRRRHAAHRGRLLLRDRAGRRRSGVRRRRSLSRQRSRDRAARAARRDRRRPRLPPLRGDDARRQPRDARGVSRLRIRGPIEIGAPAASRSRSTSRRRRKASSRPRRATAARRRRRCGRCSSRGRSRSSAPRAIPRASAGGFSTRSSPPASADRSIRSTRPPARSPDCARTAPCATSRPASISASSRCRAIACSPWWTTAPRPA